MTELVGEGLDQIGLKNDTVTRTLKQMADLTPGSFQGFPPLVLNSIQEALAERQKDRQHYLRSVNLSSYNWPQTPILKDALQLVQDKTEKIKGKQREQTDANQTSGSLRSSSSSLNLPLSHAPPSSLAPVESRPGQASRNGSRSGSRPGPNSLPNSSSSFSSTPVASSSTFVPGQSTLTSPTTSSLSLPLQSPSTAPASSELSSSSLNLPSSASHQGSSTSSSASFSSSLTHLDTEDDFQQKQLQFLTNFLFSSENLDFEDKGEVSACGKKLQLLLKKCSKKSERSDI